MGVWVAQSVKHLTLDVGSGRDLMVHEFKPHMGLCADGRESAWDYVSPSLSAPPPLVRMPAHAYALSLSLSVKINKLTNIFLKISFLLFQQPLVPSRKYYCSRDSITKLKQTKQKPTSSPSAHLYLFCVPNSTPFLQLKDSKPGSTR